MSEDMVLEHADGTVIGIEVKSVETIHASDDLRGLRHIVWRLDERFRAGVLYAGEQQLSYGDRLTALPMAAFWTLDSSAH